MASFVEHHIMKLLVVGAMIFASVFSSGALVLCATEGGHQAVEFAHAEGDCKESSAGAAPEIQPGDHCQDTQIDLFTEAPVRSNSFDSELDGLFSQPLLVFVLPDLGLDTLALRAHLESPARIHHPASTHVLRTVVMLV